MLTVKAEIHTFRWLEVRGNEQDWLAWQRFRMELLARILIDRSFFIVVGSPDSTSLTNDLPNTKSIKVDGHRFHVSFVSNCTSSLVEDINSSDDVPLVRLWILFLNENDGEKLDPLLRQLNCRGSGPPNTSESLLMFENDGDWIWWVNPNVSLASITSILDNLPAKVDFVISEEANG
jgi:hypothetical protein